MGRTCEVLVPWWIVESVRRKSRFGRKFDCLRFRNIPGVQLDLISAAPNPAFVRRQVQLDHRKRRAWRCGPEYRTTRRGPQERDFGEFSLQAGKLPGAEIDCAESPDAPLNKGADQPAS